MSKTINQLKPIAIKTLPPGFHADGGNLYLRVKESGSRSWVFRYKLANKVTELGLGSINNCSLKEAREVASKMRNAINKGANPALVIKSDPAVTPKTFKEYALELIEAKKPEWSNPKHIQQWENTLKDYAYPILGSKLPSQITLTDIKAVLEPIWNEKTETAVRLRGRIETILDYAAVHEESERRNPARWKGNLDKILPSPKKIQVVAKHPAAIYQDVPNIMNRLRKSESISSFALRFLILTATRSNETRGASWCEFDLINNVWVIPKDRMKSKREHQIPLNQEAVEILEIMKSFKNDSSDFIFNARSKNGYISDVALNNTLHKIDSNITVHGFRSSFRTWGAVTKKYPFEELELAIAHKFLNDTQLSYQRSDLLENRRELMSDWCNYLNKY